MGKQFEGADRTARFWAWVNGGWVKLAVRWDRDLSHCTGGPHEEGFSYTATTWTHTGAGVEEERTEWGRDCDGRYECGGVSFCPLDRLAAKQCYTDPDTQEPVPGFSIPDWERGRCHQRDHTAEAAGY